MTIHEIDPDSHERPWRFAQGTLALQEDLRRPGAEALWNMALTNGLVEIALHEGQITPQHRLPSAIKLLRKFASSPSINIVIDTSLLAKAVTDTDAARHGRASSRSLDEGDVTALARLDHHPALRVLIDAAIDRDWVNGYAADARELARAQRYLELLDHDEVQRRVIAAADAGPVSPDEQLWMPGPQECPVCGHETVIAQGGDDFGYGIVAGTCFVCGYCQSDHASREASLQIEFARRWEND